MADGVALFIDWIMEDDFSSDEDDVRPLVIPCIRQSRNRIKDYVETVIPAYLPSEFRSHFRMSASTLEELCGELVGTGLIPTFREAGRSVVDAKKQIMVAMWYFANQEAYRQLSDRFNVTYSCAHRIVRRVVEALISIGKNYVQFPKGLKNSLNTIN